MGQLNSWWAGRDLDSRPFGYQPNALTMLSYRPSSAILQNNCLFIKGFLTPTTYKAYLEPIWIQIEGLGHKCAHTRTKHSLTCLRKHFNDHPNSLFQSGPVAQSGSRHRPSEPENQGSNPCGPAIIRIRYS